MSLIGQIENTLQSSAAYLPSEVFSFWGLPDFQAGFFIREISAENRAVAKACRAINCK